MVTIFLNEMINVLEYVFITFGHNWHYLLISILIAVIVSVYLDAEKTKKLFLKRPKSLIWGSVGFGAFTPLCACGTMAVVLSLMTSVIPWGPIMAFLVSSPLMSPDTFVMMAGFVDLKFAVALTVASILLGLSAGYITHFIEKKMNFLKGQLKLASEKQINTSTGKQLQVACCDAKPENKKILVAAACCSSAQPVVFKTFCCTEKTETFIEKFERKLKTKQFAQSFFDIGFKKVLPLFTLFVIIAYVVKTYVPTEWILTLFSGKHFYSVPLAAFVGLPLYVSDASVAPLLQVLQNAGASQGAILAFMISGPGTSLGVITGLTVIMKRKAILLYTAYIFFGAIIFGYLYDMILWLM